uniref:Peptidase S1 domain-containing protein n=1 Tax=Glossina brevipalpis TaxID=37001 RepID=A0A1A9WX83_9MUSC
MLSVIRNCRVYMANDNNGNVVPDESISITEVTSGSKYTKHCVVWGIYTVGEKHIYGVGVILQNDIILSYTVINVTERQLSAKNTKEKHIGFIIAGSYRYPERIPYSQASKWMDGKVYMHSARKENPQAGLIKLDETLRLHPYYVAVMTLPEHDYNGSENCVLVGWGDHKDKFTFAHKDAFEAKVKVLNTETCREHYPNLHDRIICIFSEQGDEICDAAGGEPIICDGILTGIMSSVKCEQGKPRHSVNVFQIKDWIEEQMAILSSIASRLMVYIGIPKFSTRRIKRAPLKVFLIFSERIETSSEDLILI